ncbi:TIGR03619 family F420-dependent LLM class oxidoreductase [Mycobacterium sp. SMC-4]|uniref:TIGR03619 family F420-dependent LLM class oxidoreductase n=1 Tax=Mycobacterium sp. SMC-4 TaxID=2857059 RepID=UPI003D025B77
MRFSVSLPRPDGTAETGIPAVVEVARTAEAAGFHAVSVTDHPFPFLGTGSVSHRTYDPFTAQAYVAAATDRIRLHFSLLVACHRNPFLTAQMVATLDEASGGRTIVGIGAGYNRAEIEALGGDFARRGPAVDEAATVMRSAWTGKPVHAEGDRWTATGNQLFPALAQAPPLWRGGNSRTAVRSAATLFDGWAPLEVPDPTVAALAGTNALTIATLPEAVDAFKQRWRSAGRTGEPEICFVRSWPDWLAEPATITADVEALAAAGATWVEFTIAGSTHREHKQCIRDTASVLRASGLLA